MRIAQVSPLYESVPPQLYGGTERVVSYLTEELVAAGHQVTLFASADSETMATLAPMSPRSLRLDTDCVDQLAHHVRMVEEVYRRASEFDVIHFHIDYLHLPLASREETPHLTTLHGRLDLPDLQPLYRTYPHEPTVSISNSQRAPLEWLRWLGTVHHGLPRDLLPAGRGTGGYLAFLGRMSPEKRPDRAIQLAQRTGIPLKMAAKVDRADKAYYEAEVRPLMRKAPVEYIGEITEAEKAEFLGDAMALLFPIDWPEPFGLVMIEAMACGTPVIAWRRGSVPEIIEDGVSGVIVDSMDQGEAAVRSIGAMDRGRCRRAFEARFTADRMARDYVECYRRALWATEKRKAASAAAAS
jgi:glycosyltransferase involved in cell wall biosynthesis